MANQDAAFGMRPVKRIGGTPYTGGQSRYRIAANYGTAIFQGDMVMQVTGEAWKFMLMVVLFQ